MFMITVDNLSHFVVAATNVTPTVTTPNELSPSDYVVCATRVDPIPASTTMTFRCESTDVIGRYVFVLRTDNSQLIMCEVEVYGQTYSGMIGVSCCLRSVVASRFRLCFSSLSCPFHGRFVCPTCSQHASIEVVRIF